MDFDNFSNQNPNKNITYTVSFASPSYTLRLSDYIDLLETSRIEDQLVKSDFKEAKEIIERVSKL